MSASPPNPTPAVPAALPLRLEFTYEFADLAEASAATASISPSKFRRGVFGWVLFIGLAIVLFMLLEHRRKSPPPAPAPPPAAAAPASAGRLLLPLLPWVLIFLVIWLIVFLVLRRSHATRAHPRPHSTLFEPGQEPPPRPTTRAGATSTREGWLLLPLVGLAITVMVLLVQRPATPRELVVATFPWLVAGLIVGLILTGWRKSVVKRLWETQPTFHRPHVVEVYPDHIVYSTAVGRFDHRWEAFTHVRETPGLFVLYESPYLMNMLPKRAFAGREEVDAFRELLRRTVAQRPDPAFPVLPAIPVLPPAAPPPLPTTPPPLPVESPAPDR
jgi:hypothetical protein